ncbi:MAG TPA: TraR/DksA C4-type zinc finger protein [Nitriliruptorales bacterium]
MATRKKPTKTALKTLREQMQEERAELVEQIAELDASADVAQWRDAGFDDDAADSGSAAFERERAQSLAAHARSIIRQIDDAFERMEAGTYGICGRCGEPIEQARLEAIPYSTLCLDDKRREEMGR